MNNDWYEPPLKFPRPFEWREPDENGTREIHADNPTLLPCWDMLFVDWITEMSLSTEDLEYYYDILNNDTRLSNVIDRVVFERAKFNGGGLVVGYDKRGRADEVPAELEVGGFVITAKAVREIGVDVLYQMLHEADPQYKEKRNEIQI